MYCPQCGAQAEQPKKFCQSCGLKLTDHVRPLENPREAAALSQKQMQRERWVLFGVGQIMGLPLLYLTLLVIFGVTALFHPAGRPALPIMFILYLTLALIPSIFAVACLVWGGFFKEMKERKRRYELARLEQQRKASVASDEGKTLELQSPLRSAAMLPKARRASFRMKQ